MPSGRKDIHYYIDLPYRIEIIAIPEEKGGGFMACLPQFGRMAAVGDGETIDEAVTNLKESQKALFEEYLRTGMEIPEPDTDEEDYSGKFVLRIPKYLHKDLAMRAKSNGISLNQFIISLLSFKVDANGITQHLESIQNDIRALREHICET